MKKLLFTFFLFIAAMSISFAQYDGKGKPEHQYVIKTNLLPIAWGPIPFTGEYRLVGEAAIAPKQSVQLALSYLGPSAILNASSIQDTAGNNVGVTISGYRIQATYKFFLTKSEAPKGFYVGPHISFASAKLYDKNNKNNFVKADYFNAVAMLGYQVIADNGFAFDFFTGVGYKSNSITAQGNLKTSKFTFPNNMKVYFGFNMGMAF